MWDVNRGLQMDDSILFVTKGGADAEHVINGTLATALKPPIFLNAFLKSEPLIECDLIFKWVFKITPLTIQVCNGPHALPQYINAAWRKESGTNFSMGD